MSWLNRALGNQNPGQPNQAGPPAADQADPAEPPVNPPPAGEDLVQEDEVSSTSSEQDDIMVAFEDEDGRDSANALTEACRTLEKLNYDPQDILFSFGQAEIKMAQWGVKKQWTKFQALSTWLPKNVLDQVKPLLRKTEDEYQNDAYKKLKTEVLRIFSPKPEASIERAFNRVLVDKPSSLARELVNDICKEELDGCCCPDIISFMWKKHLSPQVRAGIAKYKLSRDNFNEVTQLADEIHESNMPSISAIQISSDPLNETQPGLQYPVQEVNAIRRGSGRGQGRGRGFRGRGRGGRGANSNSGSGSAPSSGHPASSGHKGTKHPDLPDGEWTGCFMHFRHGRGAYFCAEPATCPWKNIFTPRPPK